VKYNQERMAEVCTKNMIVSAAKPSKSMETQKNDWQQIIDSQQDTNGEQGMDEDRETESQQRTNAGQKEDLLVSLFERWDKEEDETVEESNIGCNDDSWEQILKDAPSCERYRCYNCIGGKCVMLSDAEFGHRGCPFYKPFEKVRREQRASLLAMLKAGRYDLVKKYRKQYAALDVVEIGDLELEKMFYSLRIIEEDLQKRQRREREKLREETSDIVTVMNNHGNQENTGDQNFFFSEDGPIGNEPVGVGTGVDDTARDCPVEDDPWEDCQAEAWIEEKLVGGDN